MFFPIIKKMLVFPNSRIQTINALKSFILQNEYLVLKNASGNEFVIEAKNINRLMFNSFLPTIKMTITGEYPTSIFFSASLKNSTKLILILLSVIASIFELLMVAAWLLNGYSASLILLLPIAIILSALGLANLVIRFSTRNITKQLVMFLH